MASVILSLLRFERDARVSSPFNICNLILSTFVRALRHAYRALFLAFRGVQELRGRARELEFRDARAACNDEVCPSLIRPLPPPPYAGSHASAWRAQDTGDIRCGSTQRCMFGDARGLKSSGGERASRPPACHTLPPLPFHVTCRTAVSNHAISGLSCA